MLIPTFLVTLEGHLAGCIYGGGGARILGGNVPISIENPRPGGGSYYV